MRFISSLICAALALIAGCSSSDYSYQAAADIRGDVSPDQDWLAHRPVDVKNAFAIAEDENLRMMNEDLARFLLIDRPSHLSQTPIAR